ncbi:MAG: hypothetical protein JNK30_17160 [Phenylobacterium sp.]|uniref:hypothetical protein n=1 Tax=Phenylobacterium sp. TaxID=1871053 RepID=UPI001A5E9A04|nr:hypothetical protein [Phenylobacterium sp.]MBL8773113.1 hypothetical protein [Phenylobacterium sp.]
MPRMLFALAMLLALAACSSDSEGPDGAKAPDSAKARDEALRERRDRLPRPEASNMPTPAPGYEDVQPK